MIRFIVARYYLWRCPFNGKRLKKSKSTKSYYVQYKIIFGHRGRFYWKIWARISNHAPTKGKGKIKHNTKYKNIIIKGFTK